MISSLTGVGFFTAKLSLVHRFIRFAFSFLLLFLECCAGVEVVIEVVACLHGRCLLFVALVDIEPRIHSFSSLAAAPDILFVEFLIISYMFFFSSEYWGL